MEQADPQEHEGYSVNLPGSFLRTRWVPVSVLGDLAGIAQEEAARAAVSPGWNVKVRKLRGDMHLIDVAFAGDEVGMVHVALLRDHPFIRQLPGNAPRATRSVYRKDVRLAHMRATDAMVVIAANNAAHEAWAEYQLRAA